MSMIKATPALRPELPPLPKRIAALPEARGYPVPWFVAWVDGEPEFRAADGRKIQQAIKSRLCWVCGQEIGRDLTFVVGPMCTVNRISAEPHCHAECADFSARACPFLSRPHMIRRENDLPEGRTPDGEGPGIMIRRNPGVTCLWTTRMYALVPDNGGVLFQVGSPVKVRWYAEERAATRAEVEASIESGLPILREMAEREGPAAVAQLGRMLQTATAFLPAPSITDVTDDGPSFDHFERTTDQ